MNAVETLPRASTVLAAGALATAVHRQAVTRALTGRRVRQVIRERGIRLVSYADALKGGP
jgi:hypothetical protein